MVVPHGIIEVIGCHSGRAVDIEDISCIVTIVTAFAMKSCYSVCSK